MEKMLALGVVLSAYDQLSPALGKATQKINKFDKQITALGGSMAKYGTMSLAAGTAISSGIGSAVTSYQDLAAAQGDIASLGIGESGIAKITKEAKAFSNEFAGTTAPDFVRASYDIKSGISSLSDEGVAKFTRLAAITGAATKSTTEEMTKMFALGHGIFKQTNETDFEFGNRMSAQVGLAVKAFRTEGSDLIAGISNIGAMANKMGVSLSEELAIIGNSKGAFDSASEAATGYRAFLQGVGSAQEELGLQFTDSEGKMLPMVQILEQLKEKYGDTLQTVEVQDEIIKAFGSGEAVKTINGLIDKTDQLRQSQIELNNATLDNVEAMAKARNKGREFEILNQKLGNASATIGKLFAPAAYKLGEAIGSVANSVSTWIDDNEGLAETLGWVIAGTAGVLTVVGTLGITVGGFLMVLPTLTAGLAAVKIGLFAVGGGVKALTMAFAANPIYAAITGIAIAAVAIYTYWNPIKKFFVDFFATLKSKFAWLGSAVSKVKSFGSSIKSFFGFGSDDKKTAAVTPRAMKINKPAAQNVAQTNHIKVNVNNPASNVEVEKAIVSAMNRDGADRGLSDEDI
ncbi:phage tail tape measure protein [Malaciobacter canalis]|uniref:Phage tail tape measure protein n=1 Tax=Malaciobacter canalis TaxID=1912871 RepID=A0ABX4LRY5_9BACT|nr:phage tail tape measure protein [Malaciobacter canalis]PHO10337.1 phage tail tape measure protein [Malaciobacter canalis]QEE32441.1 phage tail tape measure protein, TP901 family [Malaciobacter canalis]